MNLILKNNRVKGFFIDPITHAFQHHIDKITSVSKKDNTKSIKKSIQHLIDEYGEPVSSIMKEGRPVNASDFAGASIIEDFCHRVIKFQQETTISYIEKKGYLKYLDSFDPAIFKPCFVTPPYFYLSRENDYPSWLDLNIKFINCAKSSNESGSEYFAQLVISKDLFFNKEANEDILRRYIEAKPDGLLIWIDEFDESLVTTEELTFFADFIKALYLHNIPAINLYGGFFSTLLSCSKDDLGFNLWGFSHGLEYGESRQVVPVGGGIPTNKYYYHPLHTRLDYRFSSSLLQEKGYFKMSSFDGAQKYYSELCNCPMCKNEVIVDDISNFSRFENTEYYEVVLRGYTQRRQYANQETKRYCILHYQYNKNKEFNICSKSNIKEIIDGLLKTINEYQKYDTDIEKNLDTIRRWISAAKFLIKGKHNG
jgi:hypothetical protein